VSQPGRHYAALRDLAHPAPARRRARRQGFTPNAARWARSHIPVAIQFLAWLDEHDTSLAVGDLAHDGHDTYLRRAHPGALSLPFR